MKIDINIPFTQKRIFGFGVSKRYLDPKITKDPGIEALIDLIEKFSKATQISWQNSLRVLLDSEQTKREIVKMLNQST